ncbi:bacteriophage protein gp37 [Polaromonas sp. CF318]|uniref:phage Gp37/Gp68 family protein n=1 Tax=Polaromonas sp. CF318 TaxID=1144318 RepID=UPI0002710FA0|nr:phage Gp37/Gp68 family protein [Polaromonas sp. CF318]EJL90456.1 bacteriophage protein gp37 [Polaromonas sp. CF318]
MSEKTPIEWTDATWNIITGCDIESPGCRDCYAMKLAGTRLRNHWSRINLTKMSAAGPVWTGEVRFNEPWLNQPMDWTRSRMIFVCAHGDLFHPGVPFETIDRIFAVMALCPQHKFQVLTKRTARMAEYFANPIREALIGQQVGQLHLQRTGDPVSQWSGLPMPNVWLGTSVENQRYADVRRAPLAALADAGWLTWASYEPALGPVDWSDWEFLRWMVAGGESGATARPPHPDWFRAARDFCATAEVAFLFKQWGEWAPVDVVDSDPECAEIFKDDGTEEQLFGRLTLSRIGGAHVAKLGKKDAGRLLDGVEHNEFPQ